MCDNPENRNQLMEPLEVHQGADINSFIRPQRILVMVRRSIYFFVIGDENDRRTSLDAVASAQQSERCCERWRVEALIAFQGSLVCFSALAEQNKKKQTRVWMTRNNNDWIHIQSHQPSTAGAQHKKMFLIQTRAESLRSWHLER